MFSQLLFAEDQTLACPSGVEQPQLSVRLPHRCWGSVGNGGGGGGVPVGGW